MELESEVSSFQRVMYMYNYMYNTLYRIAGNNYWRGIIYGGLAVFLSHRQY